jgi:hypothetical protein
MIYAEPILVYHVDIDIYRNEMIDTSSFTSGEWLASSGDR